MSSLTTTYSERARRNSIGGAGVQPRNLLSTGSLPGGGHREAAKKEIATGQVQQSGDSGLSARQFSVLTKDMKEALQNKSAPPESFLITVVHAIEDTVAFCASALESVGEFVSDLFSGITG